METVINEVKNSAFADLSGQPWYVRWGICALGTFAGLLMLIIGLSDLVALKSFLLLICEIGIGVVLIAFEATALANAFKWQFCGVLVQWSEKATPLIRAITYGGIAIPIILTGGIAKLVVMVPCIATGAAYFVLWMDSRRKDDTVPVAEDFA